jgi:dolichyl-phosphate-mannose-protein mannosyltransferase
VRRAARRHTARIGVGERTRTLGGFALVLAAVVAVIVLQPLGAPWWYYADADATYVANSYELGAGHYTWYLDHPGMPLQDLMAVTFDARYLVYKLHGGSATRAEYLNDRLVHLDDSRVYFRAFAAIFYVLGAAIAFWVMRSMLRSTVWGVAAGLLWLGAPGLLEQSIQYRADPLLTALVLLVGYLIVRAAERRDLLTYVGAAFALGFTLTVKIHAVAVVVPLALAIAFRPPGASDWASAGRCARAVVSRFRYALAVLGVGWLVLVVAFNSLRLPATTGPWRYPDGLRTAVEIKRLVLEIVVFLVAYTAVALVARRSRSRVVRRLFDPFVAVVLWSILMGIALPATLSVRDGFAMLVSIANGLTGRGVNSSANVTPFAHAWANLLHWPLQQFLVVFTIAVVAAAVAARRRELGPVLWVAGAAVAALFAAARFGTWHYWAPAYVLSVPAALWLFRRLGPAGAISAAALLAYVVVSAAAHVRTGAHRAHGQAQGAVVWNATADHLLKPGEVALGPPYVAPVDDIPYIDLVRLWVEVPPPRTYRFVPAREQGLQIAAAQRSKVAYYFGPLALGLHRVQKIELVPGHKYVVEPVFAARPNSGFGVVRLLRGDGVDRPYAHPLARYDPWTGFYKQGNQYFDLYGNETTESPPRRRYLGKQNLWEDSNGRLWNEQGARVRPDR